MTLGKARLALVAVLASNVVLAVLLSPLGFERRPPTDLTFVGYASIGAVLAGVLIDLAAIIIAFRRVRLASVLAIIGSVVLLLPNATDLAGVFFSVPAPPVIRVLEYVFLAVLLLTLVVAWAVYCESGAVASPHDA